LKRREILPAMRSWICRSAERYMGWRRPFHCRCREARSVSCRAPRQHAPACTFKRRLYDCRSRACVGSGARIEDGAGETLSVRRFASKYAGYFSAILRHDDDCGYRAVFLQRIRKPCCPLNSSHIVASDQAEGIMNVLCAREMKVISRHGRRFFSLFWHAACPFPT